MADDEPAASDNHGHRARLRGRLLAGGGDALLDHELIEYLLALAIPRRDTKPLAKALINRFGSFGAVLAAPDRGRTVGEAWLASIADWLKVMVGVVIPLLFAAAMLEAWVTPRVAAFLFP